MNSLIYLFRFIYRIRWCSISFSYIFTKCIVTIHAA